MLQPVLCLPERKMINENEIHTITRVEHHLLCSCPCVDCQQERERRTIKGPASTPIKRLSVKAAYLLGFIHRLSPCGSVARSLQNNSQLGVERP